MHKFVIVGHDAKVIVPRIKSGRIVRRVLRLCAKEEGKVLLKCLCGINNLTGTLLARRLQPIAERLCGSSAERLGHRGGGTCNDHTRKQLPFDLLAFAAKQRACRWKTTCSAAPATSTTGACCYGLMLGMERLRLVNEYEQREFQTKGADVFARDGRS